MKLSPRLAALAALVPPGARVVDVGTDHGYIPAYLACEGLADYICAADIGAAPLEAARRSARERGVEANIDFRLTDGLAGLEEGSVDAAIIAGMGGETIQGILQRAPWVFGGHCLLILQPMTRHERLCRWLCAEGFVFESAELIRDAGRIYPIWAVRGGGEAHILPPAEEFIHPLLLRRRDPLLPEYLDGLIRKYTRALRGMEAGSSPEAAAAGRALDGFIRMKGDCDKWPL